MNQDIFKGQWNQVKGEVKHWWGNLTDDDVAKVEGSGDKLVGLIQEKYGHTKEKAHAEVSRRLDEFHAALAKK